MKEQRIENERLKKVINWLVSEGVITSQKHMAELLGYNETSISQIVIGVKPVSLKFAKKVCSLSDKININYLLGNSDEMLLDGQRTHDMSDVIQFMLSREELVKNLQATNQKLTESIANLSETIADQQRIITRLQNEKDELEKRVAGMNTSATSASTIGVAKTPRP